MSQIVKINHPLKRYDKQFINIESGMTLAEIRKMPEIVNTLREDVDVAISVNGEIIPFENWNTRKVREGDFVLVVPWAAKGDDEKSIMNMVVMIAVMYFAPGVLGKGGWGLTGVSYAAAYVGVAVGTAMIISALSPRPTLPSLAFDEAELSQSFGWNPATIQRQGISKPRWYGLNKMYGNVSQAWTKITGTATNIQRLFVLIDLGIGPFREVVVSGTLKLNSQFATNFDDVNFQTRRGILRQSPISYFNKTKVEFATAGLPLLIKNGSPKIYETKNIDYDNLEIDLAFPRGLWDGSGPSIANHTVNITIEVKNVTASSWGTLVTEDIIDGTTDKVIRSYTTSGIITINRGSRYQIRVTKNTAEKDSVQWGDDLFLDRVREVTDEPFTYPRAALVGIKVLATAQLSGAIGFSCLSRGLYMVDYADSAQPIVYSANPGLVLADILTQPVYSGEPSTWDDLNLLLNFNGADAATSTIDESEKGHIINFTGTAKLDTTVKKFGSASLELDGDSDNVYIENDGLSFDILDNIVDDWTIDIEVKFTDHDGVERIACQYEDTNNRWTLFHSDGNGLKFIAKSSGGTTIDIGYAGEITDGAWHHIAVCKVGADIGLYLDGIQIAYDLMVEADADTYDGDLFIGQQGDDSGWFDGYIDHARVIESNILDAAPNVGLTDTITEPTEEFTNPGDSLVVERYDGYDPSELDLNSFEELVDWCNAAQVNPVNYTISDISLAVNAIITTTSRHNRNIGDVVLFRGVDNHGMVELTDGTVANVIKVMDDTHFTIDLDTSGYTAFDVLIWFGVNSSHLDSYCGYGLGLELEDALDGTAGWLHWVNHDHWFILDLLASYNIQKIRGRCNFVDDPIDIDIYISNDTGNWGAAVATNITTWQDTDIWVVINNTNKEGRYVRVVILDTEDAARNLQWGFDSGAKTIFDVQVLQSTATVEEYKPRFDFNGGFDTETTMWDAALKVCEICRCVPYFKGSKISVAIDRAGDAVFAYTSGNIIKDSFRQIFIPLNERASQIEVHYRDKDQDYQRQPFTLMNPDIGNPTAKARLDLFGITDEELAERIANNMLLKNQYIKTIARFSADIDSIASEIGDPILAPIDATKYRQLGDGRILLAMNIGDAIITVPGTFDWDDANWESPGLTSYRLMVKTADDVIETKSIIDITENSAGTETDIIVDGVFTTAPVKGDLWAAGVENYEIKKYRVINLRQDDKQRIEVTAIEYVDAIYADD